MEEGGKRKLKIGRGQISGRGSRSYKFLSQKIKKKEKRPSELLKEKATWGSVPGLQISSPKKKRAGTSLIIGERGKTNVEKEIEKRTRWGWYMGGLRGSTLGG